MVLTSPGIRGVSRATGEEICRYTRDLPGEMAGVRAPVDGVRSTSIGPMILALQGVGNCPAEAKLLLLLLRQLICLFH